MSRLDYELVFDDIDILFLFEVDDYFVAIGELIEQSKYIVIVSFCPREIGAMSEYKTITILPWIC